MWVCRIGWSGIVSIGDQIQMVSERNIAANVVANAASTVNAPGEIMGLWIHLCIMG